MSALVQPRIIRAGQALAYCAMPRPRFKEYIRPFLTEIPLGTQAIGFDRIEVDRVLDEYIKRDGRTPVVKENDKCKNVGQLVSSSSTASGISTRSSTVEDFAKAAKRATRKKQKNS